jgi:ABC-2 type transport system ATP-binding protein
VTVTVEAVQLRRCYGSRVAVDDLSFTARQGDVIGLLGPNGAGKTTAIRLLTTMLSPTSGDFAVVGIPSDRPVEIRRCVGALPENAGYPRRQTGREYLRYHARLFGLTRTDAERIADRLLADVGLAERASARISTYSRGMRQRLGIARTLINDPAVVFLDEPTLGLDPAGQRRVLDIIRDIAAGRGTTVVLSTHTLPEVEEICGRVLILNRGRTVFSGPVHEAVRAVAAPRAGALRVPPDLVSRARAALARVPGLRLEPAASGGEVIVIHRAGWPDGVSESPDPMTAALRAVLDADVPLLSFDAGGAAGLSEAFLAMTRREHL